MGSRLLQRTASQGASPMALGGGRKRWGTWTEGLEEECPCASVRAAAHPGLSWAGRLRPVSAGPGGSLGLSLTLLLGKWRSYMSQSRISWGAEELSGILEGILVLLASLSANLGMGSRG